MTEWLSLAEYAERSIAEAALADVSAERRTRAIEDAEDIARSYLLAGQLLPLTTAPASLKVAIAKIVDLELMDQRGRDPADVTMQSLAGRAGEAHKWLVDVSMGRARMMPGLDPEVPLEYSGQIRSQPRRGWGQP